MKSSSRLFVSLLALGLSTGASDAMAQVITVCHPCVLLYQDCLASGQSQSTCQAQELACCLGQADRSASPQAGLDRLRHAKAESAPAEARRS